MGNLDELSKEPLIDFPFSITKNEIEGEGKLFDYLRGKIPCDLVYGDDPRKNKKGFFIGNIIKCSGSHIIANLRFEVSAKSIRFESSEESYSKTEKSFINEIRKKTREYFLS